MVRNFKRKTNRGTPVQVLEKAANDVKNQGKSIRSVAKDYSICHVTLYRFCKAKQKLEDKGSNELPPVGYRSATQVFTEAQEQELTKYLLTSADAYYGLTPNEVRELAYELAVTYKCNHPKSWIDNGKAGVDWLSGYMKRNPALSIRCAEATSLSRATSFNKHNVGRFFSKLDEVISQHKFSGNDIWNIDETGITTVQAPSHVVAKRGSKQVGALTSGERGTLVTLACAISAIGNTIPPMFVFPRKRYFDHFVQDGPPGCIGSSNKSGWMQQDDFLVFLKHFAHCTKVTVERKVLLLLDNHSSHRSVAAIDFCKQNGIILLSFPPHCSHKLQPLDRGVYEPLKKFVNGASDAWMKLHPGKTMKIYHIPGLVKIALPKAATPNNIQSGFRCAGIWPFFPDIFEEHEFAPSQVTDRPDPAPREQSLPTEESSLSGDWPTAPRATVLLPENAEASSPTSVPSAPRDPTLQTQHAADVSSSGGMSQGLPPALLSSHSIASQLSSQAPSTPAAYEPRLNFSPGEVRPLPKAPPRTTEGSTRKRMQSEILTDTPVKMAIEEAETQRSAKAKRKIKLPRQPTKKNQNKSKRPKKKKKEQTTDSSDDDENHCLVCREHFENSHSKEVWIQCVVCHLWAHEACTPGMHFSYVCHDCDSDGD